MTQKVSKTYLKSHTSIFEWFLIIFGHTFFFHFLLCFLALFGPKQRPLEPRKWSKVVLIWSKSSFFDVFGPFHTLRKCVWHFFSRWKKISLFCILAGRWKRVSVKWGADPCSKGNLKFLVVSDKKTYFCTPKGFFFILGQREAILEIRR